MRAACFQILSAVSVRLKCAESQIYSLAQTIHETVVNTCEGQKISGIQNSTKRSLPIGYLGSGLAAWRVSGIASGSCSATYEGRS